jgi:hypothetical protein
MLPCTAALTAVVAVLATTAAAGPLYSTKRGLVFIPNNTTPADDTIWITKPTDLTWYYNYQPSPAPAFNDIPQSQFEFVPMLWGAPSSLDDTSFLSTVKSLIQDQKTNISHVLTFNEPDGAVAYGGSNIQPSDAAQVWVNNIIPLQKLGVRVGLPACTGGTTGIPWLQNFLSECSKLVSSGGKTQNCTYDFVTIHWYGNFEGLASHMGEYSAACVSPEDS